jgi:hypothetical protein
VWEGLEARQAILPFDQPRGVGLKMGPYSGRGSDQIGSHIALHIFFRFTQSNAVLEWTNVGTTHILVISVSLLHQLNSEA